LFRSSHAHLPKAHEARAKAMKLVAFL
jgi:hypothetical protein